MHAFSSVFPPLSVETDSLEIVNALLQRWSWFIQIKISLIWFMRELLCRGFLVLVFVVASATLLSFVTLELTVWSIVTLLFHLPFWMNFYFQRMTIFSLFCFSPLLIRKICVIDAHFALLKFFFKRKNKKSWIILIIYSFYHDCAIT